MKESQIEKEVLKIKSKLEKSKIVDDCCDIAKNQGYYEKVGESGWYGFDYKTISITYVEDKEINNIETGKEIIVRFQTLEKVLHGNRDEIKSKYRPIIDSEFGEFCILKYLPKGGKWEKLIKKIKKKGIHSEEKINHKEEINLVKDFKENFGR